MLCVQLWHILNPFWLQHFLNAIRYLEYLNIFGSDWFNKLIATVYWVPLQYGHRWLVVPISMQFTICCQKKKPVCHLQSHSYESVIQLQSKKKKKFTSFVCFVRTLSFIFLSVDGTAWKYRNIEDKLWTDDCDREQMERGKKNPKVYVFGCKMCVQKRKITTTKYCFLWQKFCMKSTKLCCPFTFIKFGTI